MQRINQIKININLFMLRYVIVK